MRSGMASEPRRDVPDVRYARSGDVSIAYDVVGAGGLDLVFAPGYVSHLTHALENPTVAGFFERLASLGRLIRFDRRGIGLSDRPRDVATLETRMDDIRAVMDATGSRRAALIATGDAGAMATLFAATYPERVAAVVLWSPYARGTAAADYPIGETEAEWQRQLDEIEQGWGTQPLLEKQFAETGARLSDDEDLFEWFCETLRCAASPGAALTVYRMAMEVDVRDVLPAIRVPVLILHRATTRMDAEFMTERIAGARRVEIPGRASIFGEGADQTLSEIELFLATATGKTEPETVLSTVLFTDIVGSTERAAELGDRRWRETLESHDAMIRRCLDCTEGGSSTQPVTASSPPSTARCARFAAHWRSTRACASSVSRSVPGCTRACARSAETRSPGSRSTWEPGSRPGRRRARCWFRAPSRISSQAPGSSSRTAESTS